MDRFSFGPPDNSIIQIAYTRRRYRGRRCASMRSFFTSVRGFWSARSCRRKGVYRGVTTKMQVSLALAYTGELMIELIQQHDQEPSVFQETLKARGAHGFHHWAVGARDFEKSAAHYRSRGYAGGILRYRARPTRVPRHLFRHRPRPAGHARSHRDQRCHRRGISQDLPGSPGMERQRLHRPSRLTAAADVERAQGAGADE